MPKAAEVAAELRKVADSLDKIDPAIELPRTYLTFDHPERDSFMAAAKTMPRPLKKELRFEGHDYAEIRLDYRSEALVLWHSIRQSKTCELVEPARPAVYRCDPILSPEEDAALEAE